MKRSAFTLIELLVTLLIFSIIVTAIHMTLRTGITAFRRGKGGGNSFYTVTRALDTLASQVRGAQPLAIEGHVFAGQEDRISFPTSIHSSTPTQKDSHDMGVVDFSLSPGFQEEKALVWGRRLFNGLPLETGETLVLCENIRTLSFKYGRYPEEDEISPYDPFGPGLIWSDIWLKEKLPITVKVSISFVDPHSREEFQLDRTLFLPLGGHEYVLSLGSVLEGTGS
jgi:prepilin-type N-terminal cleavage/methylation domain-containing protein